MDFGGDMETDKEKNIIVIDTLCFQNTVVISGVAMSLRDIITMFYYIDSWPSFVHSVRFRHYEGIW